MKVRIIETGKDEELSIIDPKTGMDWINDLMGNHDALPEYDEEADRHLMNQEDLDWWADLVERYQTADDRLYEIIMGIEDEWRILQSFMDDVHSINCDLENYPERLNQVCDEFENE
jgi:hypothetical protein